MKCQGVLVRCMDYRLWLATLLLQFWLTIRYRGSFDLVSIAGGGGNWTKITPDLKLAVTKHRVRVIIVTGHEDCGAGVKRGDLATGAWQLQAQARINSWPVRIEAYWFKRHLTWGGLTFWWWPQRVWFVAWGS